MFGRLLQIDRRKIWQRLNRLLVSPGLEPAIQAERIHSIERDVVLPIKLLIIGTLVYYFFFSRWLDEPKYLREVALDFIRRGFLIYIFVNAVAAAIFWGMKRLPLPFIQWSIYTMGLLDGILLGALVFITGGFSSIVFWIFPVLILRNAISIPHLLPQITLNSAIVLCYIFAGSFDVSAAEDEAWFLDRGTRMALSIGPQEHTTEPFLMRIVILVLWALCCYGVQALMEKHRRAVEEAVEFATRQEQLQTAGRLAAQIAHRIKNPLSIINNSAFCLERSMRGAKDSQHEQIAIIREEVEKADRILTELMGYAQLAEGRVEKLNVIGELERAIKEAFPSAAKYQVQIERDYAEALPHLTMQRGHLSEIFLNLLQNAREAMGGQGNIKVSAQHGADYSVMITIEDSGPGIPADKIERIFEAYFSTKEKGTGLGLAIARHNAEIYGGQLRAESELGKGARFILQFPVKTVMKFTK